MLKSWPLEKIPTLDAYAITAIVQSFAQSALQKHDPLASLLKYEPADFAAMHWDATGLGLDDLLWITARLNDMFQTNLRHPGTADACGETSRQILEQWGGGERPVTFFTSGSTGVPKPCTHLEAHLRQEVTSLAPFFTDRASALVLPSHHHMYGFTFGLLLPMSLGIPIRRVMPLPSVLDTQMRKGDLIIAIPLLLSRLVAARGWRGKSGRPARSISIITGTAPTPLEDLLALVNQGFHVREFFGSSEMGVFCERLPGEECYELLPHVFKGDAAHPGTVARNLPDGTTRHYPLQDNISWQDTRRLRPGPRLDRAVQVGGINVYPTRVARILTEHEGVAECQVRLMRPEEGDRLKAFIVPDKGWEIARLRGELPRYARANLSDPERPRSFAFGQEIPRNALGKLTDW